MRNKKYNIDMSMPNSRQLRRELENGRSTIRNLKIICAMMAIVIVALSAYSINQKRHYTLLEESYITLSNEYTEITESYANISIEYANMKTKTTEIITEEPTIAPSNNNFNNFSTEDNIILTSSLIKYSTLVEEEAESRFIYNPEIPLSEDIQEYAYNKCDKAGIDYSVFLGLMRKESSFDPTVLSSTNDYGLCQINAGNHNWIRENLGSDWDPMDPYDSIDASIFILSECITKYGCDNYHSLLMIYNMGHGNAVECFNSGIYSSDYSRTVMEYAKEYGYSGDNKIPTF